MERGREKKRNLTRFHFVKSRVIFSISVDNLRKEYLVHFVSSFSLDLVMFHSLTFAHLGNLSLINLSSKFMIFRLMSSINLQILIFDVY